MLFSFWVHKSIFDSEFGSILTSAIVHAKGDAESLFVAKEMAEIEETVNFERTLAVESSRDWPGLGPSATDACCSSHSKLSATIGGPSIVLYHLRML